MAESKIMHDIHLAIGKLAPQTRLFRNNVGQGWVGAARRIAKRMIVELLPGDIVLKKARPLHAGLCEGSSDLIGWTVVTVTPDMVGKPVAVFTAIEIKTNKGRATKGQNNFIARIREAGGIAGIARTPDEAEEIIRNHRH